MLTRIHTRPLAVLFILLAYATSNAQGWERTFGGQGSEVFNDMAATPDLGWLLLGTSQSFGAGDRDIYLLKSDVDGSEQWHRLFGTAGNDEFGNAMTVLPDNTIAIAGRTIQNDTSYGLVIRTDALGKLLWSRQISEDSVTLQDIIIDASGAIIATGSRIKYVDDGMGGLVLANDVFVVKLDSAGNEIWTATFGGDDIDEGHTIAVLPDGQYLIGGYTHSNTSSFDAYFLTLDTDGNLINSSSYGDGVAEEQLLGVAAMPGGSFVFTGVKNTLTASEDDVWLLVRDTAGAIVLDTTIVLSGLESGHAVEVLPDSSILIAGQSRKDAVSDRNAIIIKTDKNGQLVWHKIFGGQAGDAAAALVVYPDNSAAFCGFTQSFGAGSADGWLVRLDSSGLSDAAILTGNIFEDFNLNDNRDSGEPGIPEWLLEINGAKNYYTVADTAGNYTIAVDTGDYTIRLITPNAYWTASQNELTVSLNNRYDTTLTDFAVQKSSDCSFLQVDVSTPFLRRCFSNIYTIHYCNSGTLPADPALLELKLDSFLIADSASVPWTTQNGNTFTFDLGKLAPFDCGSFKVYTTVECNTTVLGQTHCIEAYMTPDTICLPPDTAWDNSSLEVAAQCLGDSMILTVQNTGTGSMTQQRDFIIIEDDIITRQGTVQLGPDEAAEYTVEPDGRTVRFEVAQSVGHPGNSAPSITIEGCGSPDFSTGFVTQFPQDDGNPFREIDCQKNIGAYDPNDKRGFPEGYSPQHFITAEDDIEYLVRFQNTGTDTAFRVVIRDTLSPFLNPATIVLGASSHLYDFELYGSGILKFTFDNILLVDSTTNEAASHGFVKFRIAQATNNPPGTLINNAADIYFDFNPPVRTNETFHIVATDFIKIDTIVPVNSPGGIHSPDVYPNPFSQTATIAFDRIPPLGTQVLLYDRFGVLLRREVVATNLFTLEKRDLPAGVYILKILLPGQPPTTAKVVIH